MRVNLLKYSPVKGVFTPIKFSVTILFLVFASNLYAQSNFGIGTDTPHSIFEVEASNIVNPSSTDGVLITRIDTFPAINPTINQHGMLVFVTGNSSVEKGFYYWNNTTSNWQPLSAKTNWADSITYLIPTDGFPKEVAIGGSPSLNTKLSIASEKQFGKYIYNHAAINSFKHGLKTYLNNSSNNQNARSIGVLNDVSNIMQGSAYGVYNEVTGSGTSPHHGLGNIIISNTNDTIAGIYNILNAGNTAEHYGVQNKINNNGNGLKVALNIQFANTESRNQTGVHNQLETNNGSGNLYGTYNFINGTSNQDNYGTYINIEASANGTHYGVYSNVLKPNSYAGYFLGKVAIGTTPANSYVLPENKGATDDIMITDINGDLDWNSIHNLGFWHTSGNSNLNPTNYIGSNNNTSLKFRVNNVERLSLNNGHSLTFKNLNHNISIGCTNPAGYGGSNNISIGDSTGGFNQSGSNNIVIGSASNKNNTSGNNNTIVGGFTMRNNTTGSTNTVIGHYSMSENIAGSGNTVIGNYSLTGTTNSNYNTIIGNYSAYGNGPGPGDKNIIIGSNAGKNIASSILLYSNNILIGDSVQCPTNYLSGNLNIFDIIYGHTLDGTDSTISTGNIGIGRSFPQEKLDVKGDIALLEDGPVYPIDFIQLRNAAKHVVSPGDTLIFGNQTNAWTLASPENETSSTGISGNGDGVFVWGTAYTNGKLLRFVDEDWWGDNDGDPFNNTAERAYIDNNGQYFQLSDSTVKQNFKSIKNPLEKISHLNGYQYQFKNNNIKQNTTNYNTAGFLAQEIKEVFPEAINTSANGDLHLSYNSLSALLVEALKEQQTQIDELKKELIQSNK